VAARRALWAARRGGAPAANRVGRVRQSARGWCLPTRGEQGAGQRGWWGPEARTAACVGEQSRSSRTALFVEREALGRIRGRRRARGEHLENRSWRARNSARAVGEGSPPSHLRPTYVRQPHLVTTTRPAHTGRQWTAAVDTSRIRRWCPATCRRGRRPFGGCDRRPGVAIGDLQHA